LLLIRVIREIRGWSDKRKRFSFVFCVYLCSSVAEHQWPHVVKC
jgi:hypothetical protein